MGNQQLGIFSYYYHFEYKDRADFASKFGLDCKKFIEVMNGRAKSHKGFKFEGIN